MQSLSSQDPTFLEKVITRCSNSQRPQKLLFVFLGLKGCGKTTAAKIICGLPPAPKPYEDSYEDINPNTILATEVSSSNQELVFLDVLGLSSSKLAVRNTATLKALAKHLKSKHIIPTIVFIIERLDEERFGGRSSEYMQMLQSIRQLEFVVNLEFRSNLVLLLTHADSPVVQKSSQDRISMFTDQFASVFGQKPLYFTVGNQQGSVSNLLRQLEELQKYEFQTLGVFHHIFKNFLRKRQKAIQERTVYLDISLKNISYISLSRPSVEESGILTETTVVYNFNKLTPTCVKDMFSFALENSDDLKPNAFSKYCNKTLMHNVLPSNTRIQCTDEWRSVDECSIGQRVLNMNGKVSIITNIVKFYKRLVRDSVDIWLGRIYVETDDKQLNTVECPEHVSYASERKTPDLPLKRHWLDLVYYYIEVDGGKGSFKIGDNLYCLSTWKTNDTYKLNNIEDTFEREPITKTEDLQNQTAIQNETDVLQIKQDEVPSASQSHHTNLIDPTSEINQNADLAYIQQTTHSSCVSEDNIENNSTQTQEFEKTISQDPVNSRASSTSNDDNEKDGERTDSTPLPFISQHFEENNISIQKGPAFNSGPKQECCIL